MAAGSEGVSAVVETGHHRLGGGKKKGGGGGRGSGGFRFRVGLGFGRRGAEWSERVEWTRVEWSGRVNAPILTTVRN